MGHHMNMNKKECSFNHHFFFYIIIRSQLKQAQKNLKDNMQISVKHYKNVQQ